MAITASQTDSQSPIDQTLMDAIRTGQLEQGVLYNFGRGSYYVDAVATAVDPPATYGSQSNNTSKAALAEIKIMVPSGALKIYCTIKAGCSRTNADCHYDVTIDGHVITFASLPAIASSDWQTAQSVTVISGGLKDVSINSHNDNSGNTRNFVLDGVIIYCGQ